MNALDAYLNAIAYAMTRAKGEHERLKAAVVVAVRHGLPVSKAAEHAGIHRTTVYRWLREEGKK